jgi:hypothetical protein
MRQVCSTSTSSPNCLVKSIRVSVFSSYNPYFEEKIEIGLCDHHAVCVSVYPFFLIILNA